MSLNISAGDTDSRDTVVVASVLMTVTLSVVYLVSRAGFHNPVLHVVWAAGLSLFHIAVPGLVREQFSARTAERWWVSHSVLMISALGLTAVAGALTRDMSYTVAPVFGLIGALCSAVVLVRWLRSSPFVFSARFAALVTVFALWAAGVVWGTRYKLPLYPETLALNANVHHDPIYYAAIGNMLATYGVPSSGLNGVPYIHYHYGSAWLFSQWADLIGTRTMTFYNAGYVIIVVPLFFAALVLLALQVRRNAPGDVVRPIRNDRSLWLVIAAAAIGLLPEPVLFGLAIWHAHLLISESYLIGLSVFLLVIATAMVYWSRRREGGLSQQSVAFLFVFAPAALAVLGFLKVSLMVLLFAAAIYFAVRQGFARDRSVWVAALVSLAVCILVYRLVALADHNQGIVPFAFIRTQVAKGWAPFFPLLHFAWSWIYIAARIWEEKLFTLRDVGQAIRHRRVVDAELVFLLAVLGFLPGEILDIHGGSAFYFSDVQRWVAVALIAGSAARWANAWRTRRRNAVPQVEGTRKGYGSFRMSSALLVVVLAPFVVTFLINTFRPPLRLARANVAVRRAVLNLDSSLGSQASLMNAAALQSRLKSARYHDLMASLSYISTLPDAERRRSLLFIPQSFRLYWGMWDAEGRCTFTPLVAPALSGMALLDGMPPRSCELTNQYNMTVYQPRVRDQALADTSPASLCRGAVRLGFQQVMILSQGTTGRPALQRLSCG